MAASPMSAHSDFAAGDTSRERVSSVVGTGISARDGETLIAVMSPVATTEAQEMPESITIPEKSRRELTIALTIGLLSCIYLLAFRRVTDLNPDEGLSLQGAARILHGQVAYRDFFSLVTPGTYYWAALLFKLFGNSILVARSALVVYGGVFSFVLYLLARRVCSRANAVLGASLLTLTCLPYYFVFQHNWDSTLWACLALYCAVRFLESAQWGWALGLGFLASLTCLFEQSKGAGLVLGLAIGFLVIALLPGGRRLFTLKLPLLFAMGFAVPLLVTLVYFGAEHSLAAMLADWLWPLKHYNSVNKVPYGFMAISASERQTLNSGTLTWRLFALFALSPTFLVSALPVVNLVVLGVQIFRARRAGAFGRPQAYYILISSCIGGLWLSVLVARPEFNHVNYLGPILYLLLCWTFQGEAFGGTLLPRTRSLVRLYVASSFTVLGLAILANAGGTDHTLVTRRGTLMATKPDGLVEYIQTHVPAGGRLFMYPYQPFYYYVTATSNPTSYDFLYPGYHTPAQFREAAHQLEMDRTPVAVLWLSFPEIEMTAFPGTPLALLTRSDPMVDSIFSSYHPCKVLRSATGLRYVFMTRKDLACPPDSDAK